MTTFIIVVLVIGGLYYLSTKKANDDLKKDVPKPKKDVPKPKNSTPSLSEKYYEAVCKSKDFKTIAQNLSDLQIWTEKTHFENNFDEWRRATDMHIRLGETHLDRYFHLVCKEKLDDALKIQDAEEKTKELKRLKEEINTSREMCLCHWDEWIPKYGLKFSGKRQPEKECDELYRQQEALSSCIIFRSEEGKAVDEYNKTIDEELSKGE